MDVTAISANPQQQQRMGYAKSDNAKVNSFYENLTSAAEKSQSHAVGNAMSLTTIAYDENLSYGMMAFHSDRSTAEDPIIKISCNYGGEQRYYDVHVKEVNPSNASTLEMFAWCTWADENGITERGTFGSYQKLKSFGSNAAMLGDYVDPYDSQSMNVKADWIQMLKYMAQQYLLVPETYDEALDCNRLADELERYIAKMNLK